jgi:hypothetical protein
LRCGSSKSKSSFARDSSNLLLLRGIARFLTIQAGALLSLSHRLQARASVDDAPIYAPNSAIASFVRIRTDFRLARRSKWRNDGPKRAHRPPHGHALPRAEFPCAGLFASDHLERFSYPGVVHQLNCKRVCTDSDRVQAGQAIQKARRSTMAGERSDAAGVSGTPIAGPGGALAAVPARTRSSAGPACTGGGQ